MKNTCWSVRVRKFAVFDSLEAYFDFFANNVYGIHELIYSIYELVGAWVELVKWLLSIVDFEEDICQQTFFYDSDAKKEQVPHSCATKTWDKNQCDTLAALARCWGT